MKCKILRVPVGNDFTTRMVITAIRPDGSVIDNFRLEDADNITPSYILAGKTYEIEDFTIDGNSVIIHWTELPLGSYGFVINGYYGGDAWQMKVNTIFIIVSTNERAFIPDGTLVEGEYVINEWMSLYIPVQIQSDWDEQDTDSPSYIRNKPNLSNYATQQELAQKQDVIPDLAAIRSGAAKGATAYQKPVGGIPYYDLNDDVNNDLVMGNEAWADLHDEDNGLLWKVPAQASKTNQLADKNFVNSSIETNTATFRGTYNLVSQLGLSVNATQAQIAAALNTAVAVKDNNDYAFVQIPTSDTTPTEISRVDRYKYNGSTFAFEWSLNNSSFTAAQWAALNSGVTSGDVDKLRALPTKAQLDILFGGINDTLQDHLNAIEGKADKTLVELVEFQAGGSYVLPISPNKIYECEYTDYMAFSLTGLDGGEKCEYCVKFDVGSTVPSVTWPTNMIWSEALTLEQNKHYVVLMNYENGAVYADWKSYNLPTP